MQVYTYALGYHTAACFPYVTVKDGAGKEKLGESIWFRTRWDAEAVRISRRRSCAKVIGLNASRLRLEGRHFQINF